MKRSFEELVEYLVRDNPVPAGKRPAHGHRPRPPGRLHARGRTRRGDRRARHRHPHESGRPRLEPRRKERRPCLRPSPDRPRRTTSRASGARARAARPTRSGIPGGRPRSRACSRHPMRKTHARPSTPRRAAFPAWSGLPAAQRAAFFGKAANAIEARAEQVAQDMTAEMGKPLREARLETLRAATILRYAAGEAWRPVGELYEPSVPNQRLYTLRRPLGVVGLITPWNFPIAIPVWKLAPALIYGNTLVLKLGVRGTAHGTPCRRVLRRGGAARRCPQRPDGIGIEGRRRDRPQPRRPGALVHGLGSGREGRARRGDRPRLPRAARARRAEPAGRHGRRGARPRGRGVLCRRVLVRGPEVHCDATDPRPGRGLRRLPRAASSPASPRGRSGTPPIRRSRSGRS